MKINEVLDRKNSLTDRELLKSLTEGCGLKMSEAIEVCRTELGDRFNEERLKETAFDLRVTSLPREGHFREDRATVVGSDWED